MVGGVKRSIGTVIPTYRCYTIELQPTQSQLDAYMAEYVRLIVKRGAGGDAETNEGHINMRVHRDLCQVTLNPELGKLTVKSMAKQRG